MPIRSCIALYDHDMRRYIILSIVYVYSYVILYAVIGCSDWLGILAYAKRSSADFDNDNNIDNIMIFSFHL